MSIKCFTKLIGAAAVAAGLLALAGCGEDEPGEPSNPTQTPAVADFDIAGVGTFKYDATPKVVTVTAKSGKTAGTVTVKYNESVEPPSEVGTYAVTFDVAAATGWEAVSGLSAGTLTISDEDVDETPQVADFDIDGTGTFTHDGTAKHVTVTAKDGKTTGEITVKYNGSATAPSEAGTYTVTFDVAAADGWEAVSGLPAGTLTINQSTVSGGDWDVDISWAPQSVCNERPADSDVDKSKDDLGRPFAVVVKYNGNDAADVYFNGGDPGSMITWTVNGGHVVVDNKVANNPEVQVDVVVSGSTENGSLKIISAERMTVYLNGVSVRNPAGPAINVQGKRTELNLVGGCDRKNYLEGMGTDPIGDEQRKGAVFSENSLDILGGGFLEVRSKARHAIVADGNLTVDNVDLIIHESAGDGIHANDDIELFKEKGGTLQIKSVGDAVQSERTGNVNGITVYGGEITLRTTGQKSHGLASEMGVLITNNPQVKIIVTGGASKGIRARQNVRIEGGNINVTTTGDQVISRPGEDGYDPSDTTSSAAGIKARFFDMTGGSYKTLNVGENSKGLSIDEDILITGGTIDIRSHGDGIKVDGQFKVTASAPNTVRTESARKKGIDHKVGAYDAPPGTVVTVNESGAI